MNTEYIPPDLGELRHIPDSSDSIPDQAALDAQQQLLLNVLSDANIHADITGITVGFQAIRYELKTDALIDTLAEIAPRIDAALLKDDSASHVRMLLPIPGRDCIGIEVPREDFSNLSCCTLFASEQWQKTTAQLPILIGASLDRQSVIADLATGQNILIGGDKYLNNPSAMQCQCVRQIIASLLLKTTPSQLRLLLADCATDTPVLDDFKELPHLDAPLCNNNAQTRLMLKWCCGEIRRRQQLFAEAKTRTLAEYNAAHEDAQLPHIVFIIADLTTILLGRGRSETIETISRLLNCGAVGLHIIAATQSASDDVLTSEVQALFPWRIVRYCADATTSQLFIDAEDATALNPNNCGDVLFKSDHALTRVQCGRLLEDECNRLTAACNCQCASKFNRDLVKELLNESKSDKTPMTDKAEKRERTAAQTTHHPLKTPMLPFADEQQSAKPAKRTRHAADKNAKDTTPQLPFDESPVTPKKEPEKAHAPAPQPQQPEASEATANNALKVLMQAGKASRVLLQDAFAISAERAQNFLDEMYSHEYIQPRNDNSGEYDIIFDKIPAELRPDFTATHKTIEALYDELAKKIASGDQNSRTVVEFNKGIHTIGKKIVEEASEVWMSAEYESSERTAEEISQLLYHLLVMMLRRNITLEDLYKLL